MNEPTVICLAFTDHATKLEDLVDLLGGKAFRARVPLEDRERDLPPLEALLSGGAGFETFRMGDQLDEDRVPYVTVNTPARAHTGSHVGNAEGPGLDAPAEAQLDALRRASDKPWKYLAAALRGPFEENALRTTVDHVLGEGGGNPYVFLLHLPDEGDGKLLAQGPGVRATDGDDEEATLEGVAATLLDLAGANIPADIEGHPLPLMKTDVDAAERGYVTR